MLRGDRAPLVLLLDGSEEGDEVARALEGAGCAVSRVANRGAAESVLSGARPDLIVLALEQDGALGLCDLVRALPRGGTAAIVLVGGPEADIDSAADAILRGADAYLARPLDKDRFLAKVEALIGPLESRPPPPPSVAAAHPPEGSALLPREPTQVLADPQRVDVVADERRTASELPTGLIEAELHGLGRDPETPVPPGEKGSDCAASSQAGTRAGPGADRAPQQLFDDLEVFDTSIFREDDALRDGEALSLSGWTPGLGSSGGAAERADEPLPPPEHTRMLDGPASAGPRPAGAGSSSGGGSPGADAELSDEFRRVIDAVAQRLFPESSPDEYDDEAFDEVETIVPPLAGALDPFYEDDFALDSMETFPGAGGGLALSALDEPTRAQRFEDPIEGELEAGEQAGEAEPTQLRSLGEADAIPTEQVLRDELQPAESPEDASAASRSPGGGGRLEDSEGPATDAVPVIRLGEQAWSRGELSVHPVPAILAACLGCRVRARLVLRQEENRSGAPRELVIVLEDGRPIAASSTEPKDRLLEMLRLQGRLTAQQYEQSRAVVQSTGRRPGAVLVELGLVEPEELLPLVRWHFLEVVLAAFSIRSGSYRLEPLSPRWRGRVRIELSAAEILLEGLRRRYGASELECLLGGPGTRPRSRSAEGASPPDGLRPEERSLPSLCDGSRTVAELVTASGLERPQALAALHGLVLLGHVELPGAGPLPRVGLEDRGRSVDRTLLEERIRESLEADYFTVLGVGPWASVYELRLAHERRLGELDVPKLARAGAADLAPRIEDVRLVLDEALEILTDRTVGPAYRRSRFPQDPDSRA